MGGALTALGVYASVPASSTYDLRPPAGTVWILTTYRADNPHNLYWVNASGASANTLGGLNGAWKAILHNSKMWLRIADTGSGVAASFFGFSVPEGDPYVPAFGAWDIPASANGEARPAAGKVWVITDLILVDSNVSFRIYNGSAGITSGLAANGSGTPDSRRKVVLTNSVWLQAVNSGGSAQKSMLNGWEYADTAVRPLVGWTTTANGVTEELAPPSNETWILTHWSASNWTFNIEGNSSLTQTNVPISGASGYAANIAISGSGSWARRTGDGTSQYYMGFKI